MLKYIHFLLLTPLFVTAFWGINLLMSSFRRYAVKRTLAFFMLSGFMAFASGLSFYAKNYTFYQLTYVPVVFFALSQFPAFYVYVYTLTNNKKNSKYIYLHYLYPFLAMLSAVFIHWVWMSSSENYLFVSKYLTGSNLENSKFPVAFFVDKVYKYTFIILGAVYYVMTNRRVKAHRKKMNDYFSNSEVVGLRWINIFNILFLLALISGVFFHSVNRDLFINYPFLLIFPFCSLTSFFWVVGYFGSKQKIIYKELEEMDFNLEENQDISDIQELKIILNEIMATNKPYLQSDITLDELARYLGTNRSYLSKLINDEYHQNFNQFINDYRLKDAKEQLLQSDELGIAEIANICGFNSYNTFARHFKNEYGEAPSVFRKKIVEKQIYN